jgi:hypothetical protein
MLRWVHGPVGVNYRSPSIKRTGPVLRCSLHRAGADPHLVE